MFYQIFFSPQVKWCAIITYKHGIYELPNGLRLRILGNKEKSGNWLKFIEWQSSTQSSHQKESFVNTRRKNFEKYDALPHTKTRASPRYSQTPCEPLSPETPPNPPDPKSPRIYPNLISMIYFATLQTFTLF